MTAGLEAAGAGFGLVGAGLEMLGAGLGCCPVLGFGAALALVAGGGATLGADFADVTPGGTAGAGASGFSAAG